MAATTASIGFELRGHVAAVEGREPWGARAIAFSPQPMTGHTCVRRPGIPAAQRDQFARGGELVRRPALDRAAGGKAGSQQGKGRFRTEIHHAGNRCSPATVPEVKR
ncbi:hypothetical protein BFL28_02830 [Sphingomonas turrisvirgatae]|uniref:Uncharacterized protein n=1 Tax=Sphingomonas turrisvirgatae TaxID=1888892 RepID=A0A1E3LTS8_9SPHN|nr:hypothetical protein BFL28_02830 [Sphingomonas turrisvirgatae]